ncbi:MAG: metal ABC transporter permease [Chloroflexota bacterium]|nr:metal ABC transporter permease [Dehalococcoidia bacterium]MDW8254066.1 metal ABC transporter permease [Chloroflexota bacterium]
MARSARASGGGTLSSLLVILLTGALVAAACALLGSFLLLRKMAMMVDAISHAILPGIVAAYFLAQGPNLLAGFVGAAAAGLLTVTLVEAVQRGRTVTHDAAMGIVFSGLFALGVFVTSRFFAEVHLDADAVLYGTLEFAAQDLLIIGDRSFGPQALWVMGGLLGINLLVVTLLYKELKLATFDPLLAASLGFSPGWLQYALMTMVSVTAVGGFTAVGAVLVVALFIVPPATAFLLTERLARMIALAVALGMSAALVGTLLAFITDTSIAGAIASVAGLQFGLALLAATLRNALRRLREARRLSRAA